MSLRGATPSGHGMAFTDSRLALFGPPRDQPEPISALPEERQAPVFPVLPIIDSVPAKTVA